MSEKIETGGPAFPCHADKNYRKDGCSVYFVKRDGKATASWPYDSEGTPV